MNSINLNISNEDTNSNEFMFLWNEMNERPSKLVLNFSFNADLLKKYLMDKNRQHINMLTEMIPSDEVYIINEKSLLKIENGIYITYMHMDKAVEESIITNLVIFYSISNQSKIELILSEIIKFIVSDETSKVNIISHSISGFGVEPMELMTADYENMDYYYNDSVIKSTDKLIKKINKNKKGLSIIYGKRGTGKTVLINYIVSNLDKMSLFLHINTFDSTVNNPDFINFIKLYPNTIIVIDDCEFLLDYQKTNISFLNILQLIDGFYSDNLNLNIILGFNIEEIEEIEESLLDCNNLIDIIKIEALKKSKANDLCDFLGFKKKAEGDINLIDVLRKRFFETEVKIGYQ